jgi:hypothetical protein
MDTKVVITPVCRLSYPKLVTPEPYTDAKGVKKGDPVYTSEFLIPNEDMDKFKAFDEDSGEFVDVDFAKVCAAVAKAKFPDVNLREAVSQGLLSWPIKSGDAKFQEKGEKGAHYEGHKIVRGKALTKIQERSNAPRLYYSEKGERQMIARGTDAGVQRAEQLFYGGAYVFAELSIVAGDTPNKYVTCYINSVRFHKDGTRFGGSSLMDRFEGVVGGAADVNPTEGIDDEVPF